MKKKTLTLVFIFLFTVGILLGCNNTVEESSNEDFISEFSEYCKKEMNYNFSDIKFVKEDDGSYYTLLEIIDVPQNLQSFSVRALDLTKNFCKNNNLVLKKLNTVVLYGVEKYCGWSSDTGTLYSDEEYPIATNVSINNISDELSKVITFSNSTVPSKIYADDSEISWEIVSTQEYVRDNKKCMGYRLFINISNASDEQLIKIYDDVTKNDSFYLHTVWFYHNKADADGSGVYNEMIEQKVEGIKPISVERNEKAH